MSAPSITISAGAVATSPLPTKDDTISEVAVLDCTMQVTTIPENIALGQAPMLAASIRRRLSPNRRSTPVRTSWVAQISSAIAANRFSRCSMIPPSEPARPPRPIVQSSGMRRWRAHAPTVYSRMHSFREFLKTGS